MNSQKADPIKTIKDYLQLVASLRGTPPEKYKWLPESFLLEFGKEMAFGKQTFAGPRKEPNMCYMNAFHLAMGSDKYTYCEGYALGVIPVPHAWVIDKNGVVIDPTWKSDYTQGYFGVAFNKTYLLARALKQKTYGLLDGMQNPELYMGKAANWKAAEVVNARSRHGETLHRGRMHKTGLAKMGTDHSVPEKHECGATGL